MTTVGASGGDLDTAASHAQNRRVPGGVLLLILSATLIAASVATLAVGAFGIPPAEVVKALFQHVGIEVGAPVTQMDEQVIWSIRMPRLVLGVLVGASLGLAGAAMQGIFRNPLAEPGLVGVSAGAAFGAAAAIVLGITVLGMATVPVFAFLGAIVATLACYFLARHDGRTEVVTLLLCGVALTAIAGALVGWLSSVADDDELRDIVFWSLGSVGSATWNSVAQAAPFVLAGIILIPLSWRQLNVLSLGEREARHLGVETERVRVALIVLVALSVGAGVAVAGIVAFVGLVVPHIIRLVSGPDHKVLLPASALAGALLLVLCDLIARTVVAPVEMPLGVVTGLIGGPFFLWLIMRTRRQQGGWG